MVSLPYGESDIADEANAFASRIGPQKERWLYCLDRASYPYVSAYTGEEMACLDDRSFAACDRIIGCYKGASHSRLRKIKDLGWDGAQEWVASRTWYAERPYFYVGPMQAWHVGHVYFAAVDSHPHVVKIGFSRRVRDRLEDVESKNKVKLFVPKGLLYVGTLLDEHCWHRQHKPHHIHGEWFFHPETTDFSVPEFLREHVREAA